MDKGDYTMGTGGIASRLSGVQNDREGDLAQPNKEVAPLGMGSGIRQEGPVGVFVQMIQSTEEVTQAPGCPHSRPSTMMERSIHHWRKSPRMGARPEDTQRGLGTGVRFRPNHEVQKGVTSQVEGTGSFPNCFHLGISHARAWSWNSSVQGKT